MLFGGKTYVEIPFLIETCNRTVAGTDCNFTKNAALDLMIANNFYVRMGVFLHFVCKWANQTR